jgi:hypothetical protein
MWIQVRGVCNNLNYMELSPMILCDAPAGWSYQTVALANTTDKYVGDGKSVHASAGGRFFRGERKLQAVRDIEKGNEYPGGRLFSSLRCTGF